MTPSQAARKPTLLHSYVRSRSNRTFGAMILAVAMAFSPLATASNKDKESKESQSENDKVGQRASDPSAAKPPSEFETCKRDAEGMKGPERSRFMTACLKERG